MEAYAQGCSQLVATMNSWIAEESTEICGASVAPGHLLYQGMLRHVWACWSLHWKDAAGTGSCDGMRIADKIRGLCPRDGRSNAGANLIHDVLLVKAIISGDEPAIRYFDRIYQKLAIELARSFDAALQEDLSWWTDTKSRMIGTPLKPGYIRRYKGKGSLRAVMTQAIRHDLLREAGKLRKRRERERTLPPDYECHQSRHPLESLETEECYELFTTVWREAIHCGSDSEQAVVKLIYGQRLSVTEVAGILQLDKGGVSRHRNKMLKRFEDMVMTPDRRFIPKYQDCGEHLFGLGTTSLVRGMLAHLHDIVSGEHQALAEASE